MANHKKLLTEYSEWLDAQELLIAKPSDKRSHEQLATEFLESRQSSTVDN